MSLLTGKPFDGPSIFFLLLLHMANSALLQKPADTEAATGSRVILECRTDMTSTENPVEWHYTPDNSANFKIVYKFGQLINGYSSKMTMNSDPSTGVYNLVIRNVTLEDAGAYTCLDFTSQHKAELVVFDKYPSPKFCSVKSPPNGFIGSNDCNIEPDNVELSCDLSYRGNLEVSLECSNQEQSTSSSTVIRNEPGTSMVQLRADQLRSPSDQITCQLKYTNDKIISNLKWSTPVLINSLFNESSVISEECGSQRASCPSIGNYVCTYTWETENNATSDGTFVCMANCKIRQNNCSLAVSKVHYSCDHTQNTAEPQNSGSNSTYFNIILPVCVVVILAVTIPAISIYFWKKRKQRCKDHSLEEGRREEKEKKSFLNPETSKPPVTLQKPPSYVQEVTPPREQGRAGPKPG